VRAGPRLDRGASHVSIFPTLNISTWFLGFAQQGSSQKSRLDSFDSMRNMRRANR
jgi:hypothetical protein